MLTGVWLFGAFPGHMRGGNPRIIVRRHHEVGHGGVVRGYFGLRMGGQAAPLGMPGYQRCTHRTPHVAASPWRSRISGKRISPRWRPYSAPDGWPRAA